MLITRMIPIKRTAIFKFLFLIYFLFQRLSNHQVATSLLFAVAKVRQIFHSRNTCCLILSYQKNGGMKTNIGNLFVNLQQTSMDMSITRPQLEKIYGEGDKSLLKELLQKLFWENKGVYFTSFEILHLYEPELYPEEESSYSYDKTYLALQNVLSELKKIVTAAGISQFVIKEGRGKDRYGYPKDVKEDPIAADNEKRKRKILKALKSDSEGLIPASWVSVLDAVPEKKRIISFESNNGLRNISLIPDLYDAIRDKHCVRFDYKPFTADESKEYILSPAYLKEYNKRWFVFGRTAEYEVSSFDISRIASNLEVLDEKKYPYQQSSVDYSDYFRDMVGVTRGMKSDEFTTEISHVIIRTYSNYIHKLMLSKPMHESLKEVMLFDPERGYGELSLDVIINRELISNILHYGDGLAIVAPSSLVGYMKQTCERLLNHYAGL